MSNPKKIHLAAFLAEDAAPKIPRICLELECSSFALPGDEFCDEHTDKQVVAPRRIPGSEVRTDRRGQPATAEKVIKNPMFLREF
jgi:hypothetical protein